jgi:hypothetical protein
VTGDVPENPLKVGSGVPCVIGVTLIGVRQLPPPWGPPSQLAGSTAPSGVSPVERVGGAISGGTSCAPSTGAPTGSPVTSAGFVAGGSGSTSGSEAGSDSARAGISSAALAWSCPKTRPSNDCVERWVSWPLRWRRAASIGSSFDARASSIPISASATRASGLGPTTVVASSEASRSAPASPSRES